MPDARYEAYRLSSDFIREHIFPGGHLVSMGAMAEAARPFGLAVSAAADVGRDYACTLREWRSAWERPASRKELTANLGYPASFWRKYRFYFAYCEAGFDAGYILNYQVAFTKVEEKTGGAGAGAEGGRVGGGEGAVAAKASSSSPPSHAVSTSAPLLLLAVLSWVGGALASAASQGSPFAAPPLRTLAALASLAAAIASALVARGFAARGPPREDSQQPLPPSASLALIGINGKLPVPAAIGGGAASTAELVAAEE